MRLHQSESGSLLATVRTRLRASENFGQLAELVDTLRQPFKELLPPDKSVAEKLAKVYQALPAFDRATEKKRKPEHEAKICLGAVLCALGVPTVLDSASLGWLLGRTRDLLEAAAKDDSDLLPWFESAKTQRRLFNDDAETKPDLGEVIKQIDGAVEDLPPFDPQKKGFSNADYARIFLVATLIALDYAHDIEGHRIIGAESDTAEINLAEE